MDALRRNFLKIILVITMGIEFETENLKLELITILKLILSLVNKNSNYFSKIHFYFILTLILKWKFYVIVDAARSCDKFSFCDTNAN